MELLIVLGLCFGAYELLGVFQGCFQYQEHPLPYQPPLHQFSEAKEESDEQLSDKEKEQQESASSESGEKDTDDSLADGLGPCSCNSTIDDVFDDDTKTILKDSRSLIERKRFLLERQISKFTLSTSLMSLNREEANLFNYIDDLSSSNNNNTNNNRKFYKLKSDSDEAETAFDRISAYTMSNDRRNKRRRNSSEIASSNHAKHNELCENLSSVNNVDINKKKIFFISAAT